MGLADPLHGRALLLEQQREGGAQGTGDGLGVAQHVPLRPQLRVLAGPQLGGVDLRRLETEQVQPLAAHAVVSGQALQPLGQPRMAIERLRHPGQERPGLGTAAAVEQGPLEVRLDQPQLVALAVDAQENRGRDRTAAAGSWADR
jgi:hypothetical protein